MLSTAIFDGAVASTRSPRPTCWRMISTNTVVLPVPGGPCTSATSSAARAFLTASCWYSFKSLLDQTILGTRPRAGFSSPRNTSRKVERRERLDSATVVNALRMRL